MSTSAEAALAPTVELNENASRVIWALAWPAVALNSLQVINTLLDRFFIGHLQEAALTAHGGATNIMFLMFSLAIAMATGATALVSRGYGAGDKALYQQAARESLRLSLFAGTILAVVTAVTATGVAGFLLPANDHVAPRMMSQFLLAYACGMPGTYMIQVLAGSLRGIGDTKSPMVISGLQILLHITLNCFLVLPSRTVGHFHIPGAGLGLLGAGTALSTSTTISAIGYVLYARHTPLGKQHPFRLPPWSWVVRIMRIAIPAAMMAVLRVCSFMTFNIVLALTPDASTAIAGTSIAFGVEQIMIMPAFGLGAATSALVGQSLGMKRPDRANHLCLVAALHGAVVTLLLSLPIFIWTPQLAGILVDYKAGIVFQSVSLLRYMCVSEFLFAYAMIIVGGLQGAGDTIVPMWLSVICLWLMRVPLAIILALKTGDRLLPFITVPYGCGMGPQGAWIALGFTQGIQGFVALILWKRGSWRTKKV